MELLRLSSHLDFGRCDVRDRGLQRIPFWAIRLISETLPRPTEETLLGALFQRREPHGGRSRLRTWATTSPDRLPRRLRPNAGRDVLGSNAGIRPCARAGRSDRSAARWVGSGAPGNPAARPVQEREAAEEVEPRRGKKPMEGTSVPGARKGAGRNGPVRRATPRSRGFLLADTSTADRQREADPGCPSGKDSTARGHQAVVTPYGCERGELFEGSWRREERGPTHPGIDHDHFGGRRPRRASVWVSGSVPWWRVSAKRGEPQDRQRDATSPRLRVRRKPSRWCETTRTERGWTGGAVGPRLFGATGIGSREGPGPGVDAHGACRWRGEQVTNPRRGRVPVSQLGASAPDR
jgi:hypothetical protein